MKKMFLLIISLSLAIVGIYAIACNIDSICTDFLGFFQSQPYVILSFILGVTVTLLAGKLSGCLRFRHSQKHDDSCLTLDDNS